jgi:putative ABC transport system permease protein
MVTAIKFALRSLLKTPGFTAVALATLALGIGINTSMFTVINTVLFQQLGFTEPGRLVRVFRTSPQSQRWPHAAGNFLDLRAQAGSFSAMAAYNGVSCSYSRPGQPAERLRGMEATGDFFSLLGVPAALGRAFGPEDARPGAARVLVLSHACWFSRFGGDPGVIGREVRIDGAPATVIGVMPPHFTSPLFWGQVEVWRPMVFTPEQEKNRESNYLSIVARLAPGATLAGAAAELDTIAARMAQDFPVTSAGSGLRPVPLADANQDESMRQMAWLVMALAGFVLLIACANLANLQFARTTDRAREYAIRLALGAPRWRIMRELLVECLVLALLGAALGLLLAVWTNDLLAREIAATGTPGLALHLDWSVFSFAFVVATASGVALGLLPAWSAARADVNTALKQQSRGSTADRSHHRVRQALIVLEVALALVLLTGAGVLIRGLQRFAARDVGWNPDGLVAGSVSLPSSRYADLAARGAFFDRLHSRLADTPALQQVALTSSLPVYGYSSSTSLVAEGKPLPPQGQEPLMNIVFVTPSYFETMAIRLVQGRNFTADDRAGKPAVVLINESLARALWPGENPLGRRLGDADTANPAWREIIGVVGDVAAPGAVTPPDTRYQMYAPIQQESFSSCVIAVRGHGTAEELGRILRSAVSAIDPDLPVHGLNPVTTEIDRALGSFALFGRLLGGFALLGLALASLGIYGVLAGFVARRQGEIGVRLALGAQVRDVLTLVLGRGLGLATVGILVGLGGAFALIRVLGRILPELGPPDLVTVGFVILVLLAVSSFACWLPARRAAKINPLDALRAE